MLLIAPAQRRLLIWRQEATYLSRRRLFDTRLLPASGQQLHLRLSRISIKNHVIDEN